MMMRGHWKPTLWSWSFFVVESQAGKQKHIIFKGVCVKLWWSSVRSHITLSVLFWWCPILNLPWFHPGDLMIFVTFDSFILTAFADCKTSKLPMWRTELCTLHVANPLHPAMAMSFREKTTKQQRIKCTTWDGCHTPYGCGLGIGLRVIQNLKLSNRWR